MNTTKPKLSVRVTSVFGWYVPILLIFSYFNYREGIYFDFYICLLFCFLAIVIALPECARILKVNRKRESRLVTVVVSLIVLVAVITLLELKNRGIFIWNELYFTLPMLVFSVLFYSVTFIAEDRNNIRVYMALDGLHYEHA